MRLPSGQTIVNIIAVLSFVVAVATFREQYGRPEVATIYRLVPRHYHYDIGTYEWVADLVISNDGSRPLMVTDAGHSMPALPSDLREERIMFRRVSDLAHDTGVVYPRLPYAIKPGEVGVVRVRERVDWRFVHAALLDTLSPGHRQIVFVMEVVEPDGQILRMACDVAQLNLDDPEGTPFEFLELRWYEIGSTSEFMMRPDHGFEGPHNDKAPGSE